MKRVDIYPLRNAITYDGDPREFELRSKNSHSMGRAIMLAAKVEDDAKLFIHVDEADDNNDLNIRELFRVPEEAAGYYEPLDIEGLRSYLR